MPAAQSAGARSAEPAEAAKTDDTDDARTALTAQMREARKKRAACSALRMQGYQENSGRRLREKLTAKGFSEEETDYALAYLSKHGYLNEETAIAHLVEYQAHTRLYGKRRIVQTLMQKGYSRAQIAAAPFDTVDFFAVCRRRAVRYRLYDETGILPKKSVDALLRAGFSFAEIHAAEKDAAGND